MQMEMAGGGAQQQQEDFDMLRQIVDNLVVYSLSQEDLMLEFREIEKEILRSVVN